MLEGDVPIDQSSVGVNFHPRAPASTQGTATSRRLRSIRSPVDHLVACHYPLERWPMDMLPTTAGAGPSGQDPASAVAPSVVLEDPGATTRTICD